jgi:quinol monooxygenase YgiN
MVLVIGSIVARGERLKEALSLSQEHVLRSRGEPGCLAHAVHVDSENPNRLVFVEQWSDAEALAQHFKVPASRAFAKALAGLVTESPAMAVYDARPMRVAP